jgi:uncharacterized protein
LTQDVATDAVPQPAASGVEAAVRPFPTIWASIGWIVLYFLLQGLCIALGSAWVLGPKSMGSVVALQRNPQIIIWGGAIAAVLQIALMALYLKRHDRLKQIGLTHFGSMKLLPLLGLSFCVVIAAMVVNALYANFVIPGIKMQGEFVQILTNLEKSPANIMAGIFVVVIAAPLVEELLFRGLLQRALVSHLPVWGAILISSFAFSLVHGQLYAIPGLMSLSIAFGYIYHRTGSLRTNILLHIANNAFTLLIMQTSI